MFMVLAGAENLFVDTPDNIVFNIFDRFEGWEETLKCLFDRDEEIFKTAGIDYRYTYLDFPTSTQSPIRNEDWKDQRMRLV